MNEPDWDAGTENAYENRTHVEGLCERCGLNAPLPNEDWCGDCTLEVEAILAETEDAYELSDPKHPRHHDVMADAADAA
jgi:hypothetical protein